MKAVSPSTIEQHLVQLVPVLRSRLRRLVPPDAVDDVVQSTIATALANKDVLEENEGRLLAWLLVVGRHRAIDWLRQRGRRPDPRLLALDRDGDHAHRVVDRVLLEAALALLPEHQRSVILDVCVHGRSAAQVAEDHQVPVGTVRSRLHYGLLTLRRLIETPNDRS